MAEVRRVILALTGPTEEQEFRLGWSLWRRAHQAVAKRCHSTSWAGEAAIDEVVGAPPPPHARAPADAVLGRNTTTLSDEEWASLAPLFPENGHRGRQWRDHRSMLEAILWVLLNGASWRDLPEEFGSWQTAYYRYARWRHEGLWQRIAEVLRRPANDVTGSMSSSEVAL
ncbi:MAG: transposase [Actinomycetota bacterium]|nr:transposase [Actinomycetota bacterium]